MELTVKYTRLTLSNLNKERLLRTALMLYRILPDLPS